MRRTLTVLVTAAALLVPAAAASAAPGAPKTNASCNNGHGGNYEQHDGKFVAKDGVKFECKAKTTPVDPPDGGGGETGGGGVDEGPVIG